MREKSKKLISKIQENHETEGWSCQSETPVIREKDKRSVGKIDICCTKRQRIRCWEIEDSQRQAVLNRRDLDKIKFEKSRKGYSVSVCQLLPEEHPINDCPDMNRRFR